MKLIDKTWGEISRLHSVRVAMFWGAVSGLIMIWPALADRIPVVWYAVGGVLISVAFTAARVLKQPGASD